MKIYYWIFVQEYQRFKPMSLLLWLEKQLFHCQEELETIHFDVDVISERVLDMDCEGLKSKKVVIIGDAIVLGHY